MFRVEPLPIIRSSDCTFSFWYLSNLAATCCDQVASCWLYLRNKYTVITLRKVSGADEASADSATRGPLGVGDPKRTEY
jgi:hypothetical protein